MLPPPGAKRAIEKEEEPAVVLVDRPLKVAH
jgi:hypothetical protein